MAQRFKNEMDSLEYVMNLMVKTQLNGEDTVFIKEKVRQSCSSLDSFIKSPAYAGAYKTYLSSLLIKEDRCLNVIMRNFNFYQWSDKSIRINDRHNYPVANAIHDNYDLKNRYLILLSDYLENCQALCDLSEDDLVYISFLLKVEESAETPNGSDCRLKNMNRLKDAKKIWANRYKNIKR